MSGNVLIHVVMLLTTFSGLADRQRPEAKASPSIGHLPMSETSGRVLNAEVTIRAPISLVWRAWTAPAIISKWGCESAAVELRIGGKFEWNIRRQNLPGQRGTEGCRILSYIPEKMLCFSWNATPQMKELRAREARTHVVVQMEQLDEKDVRVRLTQLGFGHGSEWDSYYEYFQYGWPKKLLDLKTYLEREFEKNGNATEYSESTTRPDDEQEKGDFIMAAESDFAEMSAPTEQHKRFEPFAGTFKAELKMWMGPGDPIVSTGVMTNTLVLAARGETVGFFG